MLEHSPPRRGVGDLLALRRLFPAFSFVASSLAPQRLAETTGQDSTPRVLRCVGNPACAPTLARILIESGHARLVLKSDGEPAILALRRQAAAAARATLRIDIIFDIPRRRVASHRRSGMRGQRS